MDIGQINAMDEASFIKIVGPVFEHSPWIAELAFPYRPFSDTMALHKVMCQIVRDSGTEPKLALIRAHPDLVGRLALAGALTSESTREQAAAGLDVLSPEEIELFQQNNARYREKFGFPFVVCARLNKKNAILEGFKARLQNSRDQEIETALQEIFKIAEIRLRDLIPT